MKTLEPTEELKFKEIKKVIKLTTSEYIGLRQAVVDKYGNDLKFREWLRNKFIKISYRKEEL